MFKNVQYVCLIQGGEQLLDVVELGLVVRRVLVPRMGLGLRMELGCYRNRIQLCT